MEQPILMKEEFWTKNLFSIARYYGGIIYNGKLYEIVNSQGETLLEISARMYEMGLNQTRLSELLGISPSRVGECLSGKSEPTLKVAREMSRKLNVDRGIVLGV